MCSASGVWAIIVHGGARTIASRDRQRHRTGCLTAVEMGAKLLAAGGGALDAVEAAVRQLESDPSFNAGHGAALNALGDIELDASIMDGCNLAIGAVGAVQGLAHPISVARLLLDETPGLLVGDGARQFAERAGAETSGQQAAKRQYETASDTVGCVALDSAGHMAVGLSTGGLDGKMPGRVGDTPLPGCGFYVDDDVGGVALSGDGDNIARTLLAAQIMAELRSKPPQAAAERGLRFLARVGGEAGAIVLDRRGGFGCAHNSDHFAVALASNSMRPRAAVDYDELREIMTHG